jgi:hypothetical protein
MNQLAMLLALFTALGGAIVTGLVIVPAMDDADTRSERKNGQQRDPSSDGKRKDDDGGRGVCG